MAKKIRKSDDFYRESLSWMAYRYAIGITEYVGRSGKSEAERYRMFRDIEFDTEEFHALAGAFMDFLKRKKITDIVQLREKYRENDLIWLSRNYAMGRHSYAASHCEDIISYSDEVLSPQRKEFMAHDRRRELGDHLRFQSFFFDLPLGIERTHSPLDLFLRFITENDVDTEEKLLISGIAHAGIYSIKEQLDRIEKKLDDGELEKEVDDDRLDRYEETTSIEQMYEDFMWDYGCLFGFRDRVRALTSIGCSGISDSDIRIFYLVC